MTTTLNNNLTQVALIQAQHVRLNFSRLNETASVGLLGSVHSTTLTVSN